MKKAFISFLIILLPLVGFSQVGKGEIGSMTHEEMDYQLYPKDPEASAVIFFDRGQSSFEQKERGGYNLIFKRAKRIKILKTSGIEYAKAEIIFYVNNAYELEMIKDLKAFSYNKDENGYIIKKEVEKEQMFEEKITEGVYVKKFTFPDVKEGTVVEYEYTLVSPFFSYLRDWEFQSSIPTIYSEYVARLIPFYEYVYVAQGISRFDYQNSRVSNVKHIYYSSSPIEYKEMVHTFVLKDVPALRDEAYITSWNDVVIKMDFQLAKFHSPRGVSIDIVTTWPDLIKDRLKLDDIGKYLKKSERIAKKVLGNDINIANLSKEEKAEAIIAYVKQSFGWNGFKGYTASQKADEFFKSKTGNIGDINLFLVSMLRAAEINADPVLVSTRDHGSIKIDYPFAQAFNYAIVKVDLEGKSFLADGSELQLAYNRIPTRCINGRGLVLNKKDVLWVELNNNLNSLDHKTITIDLDAENLIAQTKINMQSTEFAAYEYRQKYFNNIDKIKSNLLNQGFESVDKIEVHNHEKPDQPYIINFTGDIPIETLDNKIAVSQFIYFPLQENYLKEKKRSYPIDMIYKKSNSFNSLISIPEGYKVIDVPENFEMDNELATIKLNFKVTDNIVEATGEYTFKKAVYSPSEYGRIKYYMDDIVRKFNEQVIFEKI